MTSKMAYTVHVILERLELDPVLLGFLVPFVTGHIVQWKITDKTNFTKRSERKTDSDPNIFLTVFSGRLVIGPRFFRPAIPYGPPRPWLFISFYLAIRIGAGEIAREYHRRAVTRQMGVRPRRTSSPAGHRVALNVAKHLRDVTHISMKFFLYCIVIPLQDASAPSKLRCVMLEGLLVCTAYCLLQLVRKLFTCLDDFSK